VNEDRAVRYHRLRRRAALASSTLGVAALLTLILSGTSADLASWTRGATAGLPRPTNAALAIALYTAALALGWEILSFPFVFYRTFLLDRKYGLTSEPASTWFADHVKALGLALGLTLCAALVVYGAMRVSPAAWWLIATTMFAVAAIVMSRVAPIWLMPLFYRFQPLDGEALRERLVALSARAGVPVLGAFEWGLGEKTTRANAALVGAGRTRRILVSDTLLKGYSEDEIEVILAHEIAHHVHHDLWTTLALETAVVAAALFGAHAAATYGSAAFGLRGPADLAALPLLVLAGGTVSLLLAPLSNAWSRHNERRADRFALALTQRPAAFMSAMRRLGAQNLAEERPSPLVFWFFHTHPTIDQRIAAARAFEA
jgi:Zn-dependent protease with chaperone function